MQELSEGGEAGQYSPGVSAALTQIVPYSASLYTVFHSVNYNSVVTLFWKLSMLWCIWTSDNEYCQNDLLKSSLVVTTYQQQRMLELAFTVTFLKGTVSRDFPPLLFLSQRFVFGSIWKGKTGFLNFSFSWRYSIGKFENHVFAWLCGQLLRREVNDYAHMKSV